ncbi:hypothetical protein Tco_0189595 [Tanacetum coccineum]
MHQENVQQEKLKAVKARLNFEETSRYSESGAPSRRRDVEKRLGPKDAGSMLGDKEKGMSAYPGSSRRQSHHNSRGDTESYYQSSRLRGKEPSPKRHHDRKAYSRKGGRMSESEDSAGGHWKSKSKKQRSSMEDEDLSQPWVCEEIDPFTPRIRYFDLPKRIRMPSHVKTYDGSKDPGDRLKIFQAAAKQKKCIKDPVEIHHIKQREWESTEDLVRRYKIESRDVKGAPEVMRISGFMHGITKPELIKRLHDKIPKSVDEMWKITTTFLRGEVVAGNQERKKTFPPWKQQDAGHGQNFKKGGFKNQQRPEKRQDKFALLTKIPKEILALDKGKFKPPPPMTTSVEKGNASKF